MRKILTILLYVPEDLWIRFWIVLEGEMLFGLFRKALPPGYFNSILEVSKKLVLYFRARNK